MIVRRQPPFPLSFTVSGLTTGQSYKVEVEDDSEIIVEEDFTATATSKTIVLPVSLSQYDETYMVNVYWGTIMIDTQPLHIVRPYVRTEDIPYGMDEEEFYESEAKARYIIDSGTGGFYNTIKFYETQGVGGDYLPIPYRVNKLIRVWENGDKVFDIDDPANNVTEYGLTRDKTAIIVKTTEGDRFESSPIKAPTASSDSFGSVGSNSGDFKTGNDYVIEISTGHLFVPSDIVEATKLLIQDMGTNKYLDKYIIEYDTDQYRVKYRAAAFDGTGNRVVDKILANYREDYIFAGVL